MEMLKVERFLVVGSIAFTIFCAALACQGLPFAASETVTPATALSSTVDIPAEQGSPYPDPTAEIHLTGSPFPSLVTSTVTTAITASPPAITPPVPLATLTILPTRAPESLPPTPTAVSAPTLMVTAGPSPTFPPLALDAWCVPWNAPAKQAYVQRVIDGVTIEVMLDGMPVQVAYSGLNLLEFSEDWRIWVAMTDANRSLVEGMTVALVGGGPGSLEEEPRHRYVLAGGSFVNLELIRQGYAIAESTPPEISCDQVFLAAEQEAITGGRGLWSPVPTATRTQRPATATIPASGALVVVKVNYLGTFWQEPDEYVEIFNSGAQAVQLKGWSVRDEENHAFVFPDFILGPGQYCRVLTNDYQPQHCGFNYGNPSPLWDNDGDCAYLQDSLGRLVDEFCY